MSVSGTCRCRGHQKSSMVGHCHWLVQDYGSNGRWSTESEWRRHRSANYERESFSERADWEESPRSFNGDGESRRRNSRLDSELDGGLDNGQDGGCDFRRDDRLSGRRGGGLDGGRDGGLDNDLNGGQNRGQNFRRDGRCHGRLGGGRVGGWDGAPRSSYRGTPVKLIFYCKKGCQRCNVPDVADGPYSAAHAALRNHRGLVNGGSDSLGDGGRPIDVGEMVFAGHRRRPSSSRRQRPRFVHGTDWF